MSLADCQIAHHSSRRQGNIGRLIILNQILASASVKIVCRLSRSPDTSPSPYTHDNSIEHVRCSLSVMTHYLDYSRGFLLCTSRVQRSDILTCQDCSDQRQHMPFEALHVLGNRTIRYQEIKAIHSQTRRLKNRFLSVVSKYRSGELSYICFGYRAASSGRLQNIAATHFCRVQRENSLWRVCLGRRTGDLFAPSAAGFLAFECIKILLDALNDRTQRKKLSVFNLGLAICGAHELRNIPAAF